MCEDCTSTVKIPGDAEISVGRDGDYESDEGRRSQNG